MLAGVLGSAPLGADARRCSEVRANTPDGREVSIGLNRRLNNVAVLVGEPLVRTTDRSILSDLDQELTMHERLLPLRGPVQRSCGEVRGVDDPRRMASGRCAGEAVTIGERDTHWQQRDGHDADQHESPAWRDTGVCELR